MKNERIVISKYLETKRRRRKVMARPSKLPDEAIEQYRALEKEAIRYLKKKGQI